MLALEVYKLTNEINDIYNTLIILFKVLPFIFLEGTFLMLETFSGCLYIWKHNAEPNLTFDILLPSCEVP